MRLPRALHRLYAGLMGYFWLPCARCGREFGGHEVTASTASVARPDGEPGCVVVCPRCSAALKRQAG